MKNSKLLALSTLIAAAATAATIPEAAAGTTINGIEYSGTVYTWDIDTGDLAYGEFIPTTYDEDTDEYVYDTDSAITEWNSGDTTAKSVFCLSSSSSDLSTIRFDSTYDEGQTTPTTYTFSPLSIAGIIVEDGTTGFSIAISGSTSSTRTIYLGNFTDTAAYSTINEDFTLSNAQSSSSASSFYIQGTQTWTIASDATFTLAAAESGFTVSGSLTIDGGGTASFSDGDITSSASITISSGTVSNIATLTSTGTITVGSEGSLDLSGTTVSLSEAISNSGTVTVDESTVIDLTDALLSSDSEDTYIVISSGGTITGWDALTLASFTMDGTELNSRSDVDVSTAGSVTVTTASLTWSSSSGADWSDNTVWTLSSTGSTDSFLENDIVIFDGTASGTATVSSDVTANSVTVTDNASQTISVDSGATLTAATLTVDSGATLTLDGEGTVSVTTLETSGTVSVGESTTLDLTGTTLTGASYNISGSGTVKLALLSGSWNTSNTLAVGDDFTGTTYLSSGYVTISDSMTYGANLTLADGVYLQVASGVDSAVSFDGTLTLDGTSRIYVNTNTTLTFTSDATVTGSTLAKYGAGEMIFDGNTVDLDTFSVTDGNGTVTFNENGTYSFSTFTVSNGTLNLNGATITATDLTISGDSKYLYLSGDVTFDVSGTGTISKNVYDSDSDSGSLTKTGDGTLTLSGTNTYSGGTTILAGTLIASNSSALGTGAVTISGGTLQVSSDMTLSDQLTIDGGTLSIDSDVTLTASSLSVVLSDAYLTSTTTSDDSSSTSSAAKSNTILLTSVADDDSGTTTTVYAIDGEGTLSVSEITISLDEELAEEIAALSADTTYTFSLAASTISGIDDVTITLDGLDTSSWTASLSDGTLTLTYTIPEPGSFGLIAGTLALAFAASRRRRSRKA